MIDENKLFWGIVGVVGTCIIGVFVLLFYIVPSVNLGGAPQYIPPVPGAIDIDTSTHVAQTLCNTSWSTSSIRPPTSYTNPIKTKLVAEYNKLHGTNYTNADGELDHVISLEIGGSPTSTDNLAFEPGKIPNPKDSVENRLHKEVCIGQITLQKAQECISTNWQACP